MTSLTRDDARRRRDTISVDSYAVDLDLTADGPHFGSRSEIRFRCAEPGASTFLDVAASEVRSAVLNGRELALGETLSDGRLALDGLEADNTVVVDAVMAYSHDGEGLHRHVDPADGHAYLYAMSFLEAAPRWYACFDQPDLKARLELSVRCPEHWVVAGNGPVAQDAPGSWRLSVAEPLATYFTTVLAGPYHVVRDEHDGIPLALYARRSLGEHLDREAPEIFAATKHSFDELHRLFEVRYPWGEYHQAFVPEFNAGAMENPGCVTIRDEYVFRSRPTEAERHDRAIVIAHEMAHMWFGDLVTMRWWDDLWLNESFAEYLGHRVVGEASWVAFGIERKSWGYRADRRPSTHPVAGNGAADAKSALADFDGISYAKGASTLRQLSAHLGDDVFLDGLRRHIRGHAGGNAEFADLVAAWAAAGASDIEAWTAQWLRTTGMDELGVSGGVLRRVSPDSSRRPHAVEVGAFALDGREVGRAAVSLVEGDAPVALDAPLLLPDAGDVTWAKAVLGAHAWRAMPAALPGIASAHTRVGVWNALQLAVADAEVDPRLAVDIVLAALPGESDDAIIAIVGRWLRTTVAGTCLPVDDGIATLTAFAERMRAAAEGADAGSGRQLATAREAVASTSDPAWLRDWLDGTGTPPGLVLDAELRWAVLRRLAALGELSASGIDAELARDDSTEGRVHATRCHAARPDAEAKRAAWDSLMGDRDRPNYELYALADGFWEPRQAELTLPYAQRYFDQIAATAQFRTGWVRDRVALLAFPWTATRTATVGAADALIADAALDAGIRRSVVDAADDLRRAVAVRARFG